jgi:hypothetical protein
MIVYKTIYIGEESLEVSTREDAQNGERGGGEEIDSRGSKWRIHSKEGHGDEAQDVMLI